MVHRTEIIVVLPPSPKSSPPGEDFSHSRFLFLRMMVRPILSLDIPKTRRTFLLLPGEKAGMRASVKPFPDFAFHNRHVAAPCITRTVPRWLLALKRFVFCLAEAKRPKAGAVQDASRRPASAANAPNLKPPRLRFRNFLCRTRSRLLPDR